MHVGVDYGEKRVGIAVSDEGDQVAFPLRVVPAKEALEAVLEVVRERSARAIVLGESRNYAGGENKIMEAVRAFAAALTSAGAPPVYYEPEFLTSAQAERSGVGKDKLDASAAALILQSFLDRMKGGGMITPMKEDQGPAETRDAPQQKPEQPISEQSLIDIDTFKKLRICIGEIVSAEKVPETDKLLRLMVSFGKEERQIVSGIAGYFPEPEKLIGKRVAFAYNLEPRVIRGLESRGMILAAEGEDGSFSLLEASVPPGSFVR